jgi:hypothetical protein
LAEPADMIVPMLREMRSENAELHKQTRELISALDKRLGAVETAQKSYRATLSADTLLTRLLTGEFEERIALLKRKMREMEKHF